MKQRYCGAYSLSPIRFGTFLSIFLSCSIAFTQDSKPNVEDVSRQHQNPQALEQTKKSTPHSGSSHSVISKEDSSMMRSMAKSNIAEIQLAGLAQAISENQIIHKYAQRMLNDHGKMLKQLKAIASAGNVVMPGGPDEEHVTAARQLALMKGNDFDQKFLAHAGIDAHQKSYELYLDVSKRAENTDLKNHAADTVKAISQHLKLAEETQRLYAGQSQAAAKASINQTQTGSIPVK